MADISKITLPSGTTYNIKDEVARQIASGGIQLKGVTTTALTDEATTNPIQINGESYTAVSQDAVFYGKKEFVFDGTKWHEFGDMSGLGALAYKDSASGFVTTPTGITGLKLADTSVAGGGNVTAQGTVSAPVFTGATKTVSVKGTPAGTISVGTGTANYTPGGTVSTPTITVTPSTVTNKYVASSATGGGSVTAGTAASATMPVLTTSVANETLTIGWTDGSFTANTPTAVTLPSFTKQTIATGISSATASQPTFTGTGAEIKFTGTEMTATGTYKAEGSCSAPEFTGEQVSFSITGNVLNDAISGGTFTTTSTPITVS